MEYTVDLFVDFLKEFEKYSADCDAIMRSYEEKKRAANHMKSSSISDEKGKMNSTISSSITRRKDAEETYLQAVKSIEKDEDGRRQAINERILLCEE